MLGSVKRCSSLLSKSVVRPESQFVSLSRRSFFDFAKLNPIKAVTNFQDRRDKRQQLAALSKATEKQMAALKVVPDQEGACIGPAIMEGSLIYAIDETTLKSYHNKLVVPASSILVSLLALNLADWDMIGNVLWSAACVASVINIHSISRFVTRMSVSHGNGRTPDFRSFPRTSLRSKSSNTKSNAASFTPMPETYWVELYGYPFSERKTIKFSARDTSRIADASFFPRFVTSDDIMLNCTPEKKGFRRIALEIPGAARIMLYIDQIRNLDYINQFLAFATTSTSGESQAKETTTQSSSTPDVTVDESKANSPSTTQYISPDAMAGAKAQEEARKAAILSVERLKQNASKKK